MSADTNINYGRSKHSGQGKDLTEQCRICKKWLTYYYCYYNDNVCRKCKNKENK